MINRWFAFFAVLLAAAPLAAQVTSASQDTARRSPATVPALNASRAADAEVRVALYELVANRPLASLSRLERLQASPATASALRSHDDLSFLLAEAYYRVGMAASFRTRALEVIGSPAGARYASVLRGQLMLDAYRNGDYAKALEYAGVANRVGGDSALASLVSGLARYQTKAYPTARESFAMAKRIGGSYASYAQYMDVLAGFAADTTQATQTLDALRAIAGTTSGPFGDQVRLTAAQVAYGAGQYDAAIALTDQIAPSSGFAADALFTRAWALYRAKRLDAAAGAFADFATRFPNLERRDEARLLAGQALLESGRSADAAQSFRTTVDAMASEMAVARDQSAAAMTDAAKALVSARAVGVLFITNPATGKTISLPENAGAEYSVLLRAWSDSDAALPPGSGEPHIVSLSDVDAQLGAMGPNAPTGFSRRVLYASASNAAGYMDRSEAILSADVRVGLAQLALQSQLDDNARRISQLQRLQALFGSDSVELAVLQTRLTTTSDSLAKIGAALDAARTRVQDLVRQSVSDTRQLATENQAQIDAARKSAAATAAGLESNLLAQEAQTASLYRELADIVEGALSSVVARMPVYHLRDSVNAHMARVRQLYGETRGILASSSQSVGSELAALQASETEGVRGAKGALAAAEAQRTVAEAQLVSIIDAELRSRAMRLVSLLQRDTEAGEFGAASASFFRAVDANRSGGTAPPSPPPSNPPAASSAGKPTPPR